MSELQHKVMLAGLSISVFSGEKIDRKVSEAVALTHNTTADKAGKFSKRIISKTALEHITCIAGQARALHYERTLPWSDTAGRLLSVEGFLPYTDAMGALRATFDDRVNHFIEVYPRMIEEAKTRLNGMFDESDYPNIMGMRQKFSFDINLAPLPVGGNWFLEMADETMEVLRAQVDQRFETGIKAAIENVYQQIADVTQKMGEKLSNYEIDPETGKNTGGIFRDSLIENVRKMADLLPSLNLTNDPVLAAMGETMKSQLCKFDANALRADPDYRKTTADAAMNLYTQAIGFLK